MVPQSDELVLFYSTPLRMQLLQFTHCYWTRRPNQKMELTASGCYNLRFGGLRLYPIVLLPLARGNSSWSR
jgi:hypothetical protein